MLLTQSSPMGFHCILLPLSLVQVITVFLDCNRFPPQWQISKPSQTFETIEDNTGQQATQYCQDPPLSRQVQVRWQNPQPSHKWPSTCPTRTLSKESLHTHRWQAPSNS